MSIKNTSYCLGYQQLTSLNAAVGLTLPTGPNGERPTACLIRAEAQSVRWRDDQTAPTASVGMLILTADLPFFYDGDLTLIRFIETTASAKLNVSYYR